MSARMVDRDRVIESIADIRRLAAHAGSEAYRKSLASGRSIHDAARARDSTHAQALDFYLDDYCASIQTCDVSDQVS